MQEAFKQVQNVNAGQSLLEQAGHQVPMWTPEALNLRHKQVGIQFMKPREFAVFTDQVYPVRDESEAIFTADASIKRGLVNRMKPAMACALEVLIQHGARGAVILDPLIDAPLAKISAVETKLAALGWFEATLLTDLPPMLEQFRASDDTEREVIEILKSAIQTTISYRMAKLDDTMGEAQRAREGGMGRASLTREERFYYQEIGLVLPDTITQAPLVPKAGEQQPEAQSGIGLKEVVDLMGENNKNLVQIITGATEALVTKIIDGMRPSGGNNDAAKEANNGTSDGTSANKQRRSPLSSN